MKPPDNSTETEIVGQDIVKDQKPNKLLKLASLRKMRSKRSGCEKAGITVNIKTNDEAITEEALEGDCFFCGAKASVKCRHCQKVYYCSQEHLDVHRPENYCHPFKVLKDPVVGRYTVASRDIKPCELILSERPAVSGPYTRTGPICLQCYAQVSGDFLCPICGCPMCNKDCAESSRHQLECHYAALKSVKLFQSGDLTSLTSSLYASVAVLRMMLTKCSDPSSYDLISNLMDHDQERRSEGTYSMTTMKMTVMSFLKKTFGQLDWSEDEVERNIGILRTNGMKLEQGGLKGNPGVVLYPIYCLINHACYNNTNYVKQENLQLQLRAQMSIREGEEITTRYVSSTLGNCRRRRDLSKYWYFSCTCVRCRDSTEFGTHMSSVRCSVCKMGLCVKIQALDWDSDWQCNVCSKRVPDKDVIKEVERLEEELSEVDRSDTAKLEEMIALYSDHDLLHSQHYLVIELMHCLALAYSGAKTLTRPQMERTVQLSCHVLEVLGCVDPGFTVWRGQLLHGMATNLLFISRTDKAQGTISDEMYKRRLYSCMRALATAKKCQTSIK